MCYTPAGCYMGSLRHGDSRVLPSINFCKSCMCQICISVHFGSQNKGHTFYTTSKIIGECAPILAHMHATTAIIGVNGYVDIVERFKMDRQKVNNSIYVIICICIYTRLLFCTIILPTLYEFSALTLLTGLGIRKGT